jgi:hypothetical protein
MKKKSLRRPIHSTIEVVEPEEEELELPSEVMSCHVTGQYVV